MKIAYGVVFAVLLLSGCKEDNDAAFEFAKKEVITSVAHGDKIKFKDLKLVRVVKNSDSTSRGVVCGKASRPEDMSVFDGFAVFYTTELDPSGGDVYYNMKSKILPNQDNQTVNLVCD